MKIAAVVLNVVFFLFSCLVLVTDGLPNEVPFIVVTVLVLAVPVLTVVALLGRRPTDTVPAGNRMTTFAACGNVVLLAAICWSLMKTYPHPKEPGFIEYVVLAFLIPIVSLIALLVRGRARQPATARRAGNRGITAAGRSVAVDATEQHPAVHGGRIVGGGERRG
jgi:hypothetical protein